MLRHRIVEPIAEWRCRIDAHRGRQPLHRHRASFNSIGHRVGRIVAIRMNRGGPHHALGMLCGDTGGVGIWQVKRRLFLHGLAVFIVRSIKRHDHRAIARRKIIQQLRQSQHEITIDILVVRVNTGRVQIKTILKIEFESPDRLHLRRDPCPATGFTQAQQVRMAIPDIAGVEAIESRLREFVIPQRQTQFFAWIEQSRTFVGAQGPCAPRGRCGQRGGHSEKGSLIHIPLRHINESLHAVFAREFCPC